ncbi:hypothetical protein F5878DRAFT_665546 [Lentinula raphanica]|uniref:Uncharacterized protein n=1 Tax=Lentinula raphanica TaxID=153919 RepID=A0AA38NZK0_9AGAR|nr:hypothetical protein F5878DRAFT_665546 [Lentinula raphanica]
MELLGKGWVMPESQGSKRLKLKDGSPLLNNFGPETRYQKIVKYAQSKNWPVLATLYNDLIPDEEDYADQLGDPTWLYLANVVESSQGRSSNNVATVYRDASLEKLRSVSVEEKSDKEDSNSEVEVVEETSETTRKVRFREPSPSRSDETHQPFDHVPPREVSPIPQNLPKSKPEKVTESKGPLKGPKVWLRNELFIPGLEEELAN